LFHRIGILYGAGKVTWNRNVIFLWFLKIFLGNVFFELSAKYTRGDVVEVYENIIGMKWFSNGLGIKHFRLPFFFGAAPAFTDFGAFFDALIRRRRMDDPLLF
jgi:hypothetical protein